MKINLNVKGTNGSPLVKVTLNNDTLFDSRIPEGPSTLEFISPLLDTNTLKIEHYGKQFGENRKWDTYEFVLCDILLDDVSIKTIWHNGTKVYIKDGLTTDSVGLAEMVFGFNGYFEIQFTAPVYDWIISKRTKQSHTSMSQSKFQYYDSFYSHSAETLALLSKIKSDIDSL